MAPKIAEKKKTDRKRERAEEPANAAQFVAHTWKDWLRANSKHAPTAQLLREMVATIIHVVDQAIFVGIFDNETDMTRELKKCRAKHRRFVLVAAIGGVWWSACVDQTGVMPCLFVRNYARGEEAREDCNVLAGILSGVFEVHEEQVSVVAYSVPPTDNEVYVIASTVTFARGSNVPLPTGNATRRWAHDLWEEFIKPPRVRCILHLLNRAIRAVAARLKWETGYAFLWAWNGYLHGRGCEVRRARWRAYLGEVEGERDVKTSMNDKLQDLNEKLALDDITEEIALSSWHGQFPHVKGATWKEVVVAANTEIKRLEGLPAPKADAAPDAGGTRFKSMHDAIGHVMAHWESVQGFLQREQDDHNVNKAKLANLWTLSSQPNTIEQLTACKTILDPAIKLMSSFSGGGKTGSWQVHSMMTKLLNDPSVDDAVKQEITKRYEPCSGLWKTAVSFNPKAVECMHQAPMLNAVFATNGIAFRVTPEQQAVYEEAIKRPTRLEPVLHWKSFAAVTPDAKALKRIALIFLKLQPSTAQIEGLFSKMQFLHDKRRNRIDPARASKQVFCAGNASSMARFAMSVETRASSTADDDDDDDDVQCLS